MEFPHLGKNCSHASCNKLDFLPMKCDACRVVFCTDHFHYAQHKCPSAYKKDLQVPECPLCGAPVPGKRGEAPDIAVGEHIDNDCQADPAKERRKKVFTNRCAFKSCKAKEMVPLICSECSLNFCFRHRHAVDHSCVGKLAAKRRQAAEAALSRLSKVDSPKTLRTSNILPQTPVATFASAVQGNMTEDEALAHALALSMQSEQPANVNVQAQDTNLARALMNRQRVGGEQSSNRCIVS